MSAPLVFSRADADIFVPDGADPRTALARTTHLCIAAHQDDIEIMAHAGIAECHGTAGRFFTGVVATNGAGSPRAGAFAHYSDAEMQAVRREEQRAAARIGRYNLLIQLAHPSAEVKTRGCPGVAADLDQILAHCRPTVIYLHNPADKHDTHVGLFLRCLEALRRLPASARPARVLGCEVWRDLDWLPDEAKVALDAGRHSELALPLLGAFASQIAGGKRYDLATIGRRAANATFHTSHATDQLAAITWAMELTPLVRDEATDVAAWVDDFVQRFAADIAGRLHRLL